jgi:long-subunit acyl-CoA synthetase (AMP-forming)
LIWLSVVGAGGRILGTNPASTSSELERSFGLTRPKFIIAQSPCSGAVLELVSTGQIDGSQLFLIDDEKSMNPSAGRSWQVLLQQGEGEWVRFSPGLGQPVEGQVAAYATTSGTTGLPKAAILSHQYIVAEASILESEFQSKTYEVSCPICRLPRIVERVD